MVPLPFLIITIVIWLVILFVNGHRVNVLPPDRSEPTFTPGVLHPRVWIRDGPAPRGGDEPDG
jgi:hypothetical protein